MRHCHSKSVLMRARKLIMDARVRPAHDSRGCDGNLLCRVTAPASSHSSSVSTLTPCFLRLCRASSRRRAGDDIVGLLRHRAGGLGAEPLGHRLRLVARHLFQRAGEHHGLAGDGRIGLRLLGVEDRAPAWSAARRCRGCGSRRNRPAMRLDHGVADLVERIHLGARLLVALGDFRRRRGTPPRCRSRARARAPWSRRHGGCRARR